MVCTCLAIEATIESRGGEVIKASLVATAPEICTGIESIPNGELLSALELFKTTILAKHGIVEALTIEGINAGIMSLRDAIYLSPIASWQAANYDMSGTWLSNTEGITISPVAPTPGSYGVLTTAEASMVNGYILKPTYTVCKIIFKIPTIQPGAFFSVGSSPNSGGLG